MMGKQKNHCVAGSARSVSWRRLERALQIGRLANLADNFYRIGKNGTRFFRGTLFYQAMVVVARLPLALPTSSHSRLGLQPTNHRPVRFSRYRPNSLLFAISFSHRVPPK